MSIEANFRSNFTLVSLHPAFLDRNFLITIFVACIITLVDLLNTIRLQFRALELHLIRKVSFERLQSSKLLHINYKVDYKVERL